MFTKFYISHIEFLFVIFSFWHQFQTICLCSTKINYILLCRNFTSWNNFLFRIHEEEYYNTAFRGLGGWSIYHLRDSVYMAIGKHEEVPFFSGKTSKWNKTFECKIFQSITSILRNIPEHFMSFKWSKCTFKFQITTMNVRITIQKVDAWEENESLSSSVFQVR